MSDSAPTGKCPIVNHSDGRPRQCVLVPHGDDKDHDFEHIYPDWPWPSVAEAELQP